MTHSLMFGYEKEEMMNQDAFTLTEEGEHEALHQLFLSYPEQPYVLKAIRKGGASFYIEVLAHPYPHGDRILRPFVEYESHCRRRRDR